jgi:hypothetical protein
LAFTQLIERFIGFDKRERDDLAAHPAGSRHSEHFSQVLAGTNRRCVDPDLSRGHQNRRKTDVFRR